MHPVVPPAVAELRERRLAGLEAYGGSHDSLHSYSSLHAAAPLTSPASSSSAHVPCTPQRNSLLRPTPARLSAAELHVPTSHATVTSSSRDERSATAAAAAANESCSAESSAENLQDATVTSQVEFGLHELRYDHGHVAGSNVFVASVSLRSSMDWSEYDIL